MNSALLISNAIALTVLLGFQFAPENGADEMVARRMPHYLQLQKAPQLAVMNDRQASANKEVSQQSTLAQPSSDRLIF
ncbi:hypothetical protein CS078_08460 [Pseudomonas prosekii]|uniref:Uncharacterized protein n=1 Tax=Pseudomonas prosekii TaxID=1148509 RepID=A0A3L8CPP0_9PSED|nr:hypothetical protein [Pseudomonas prosekii]RLU10157.1 hypothetical protein CS078_08460 [Pseudomonas prosekii]RLU13485.1 hypothetical protein CS076_05205 [Pseudomonas prosekii]